ncbi:MAG TPA: ADP-ribosylglycohydrolase family protein [Cyanophyceae cyanobacterium]
MRYSLLSRFRGTLLGSFVGEVLASVGSSRRVLGETAFILHQLGDSQLNSICSDWSQIATCGLESLIRYGKLDLDDWVSHSGLTQPSLVSLKKTASSSETAVATLPVALFFHDDEVKLRQQMIKAASVWQQEGEASEGVLAMAFAIATFLTEKLDFTTLIPLTLSYLGSSQTPLSQQLQRVQVLLEQSAGLDTVLTQLRRHSPRRGNRLVCSDTSIALAFYCFLSTPEDFRLCIMRAVRSNYQPQITAALAGALSGAYNSMAGLPVSWRLAVNQTHLGLHRQQLADRLLAVWSGAYDSSSLERWQFTAVAAPQVIQPR